MAIALFLSPYLVHYRNRQTTWDCVTDARVQKLQTHSVQAAPDPQNLPQWAESKDPRDISSCAGEGEDGKWSALI